MYSAVYYDDPYDFDEAAVRPLFYGMWAFNNFMCNSSRLMNTNVTTTNEMVKIWAAQSATGAMNVLVIHKDMNATENATVTILPPAGMRLRNEVVVVRLLPGADGVYSSSGISLGGLTFDGTGNGVPVGTPVNETVAANADGGWTVTVQPLTLVQIALPGA